MQSVIDKLIHPFELTIFPFVLKRPYMTIALISLIHICWSIE